ncbi:MAG: hypothetical protein JNM58_04180 [Xanthomonadaceae bacterium]|nr:hypothetical protein [Xanthomonadaceae bacterium]
MSRIKHAFVGIVVTCGFLASSAQAIDKKYRAALERSGCTQLTEMQGCDINKTKAQNAQAGFGATASRPPASSTPRYKDLVHRNSIDAIDAMMERGFKNVDSINSANTQYGIFYHPGGRLCVQLTMADGEVLAADDIHSHPNCH